MHKEHISLLVLSQPEFHLMFLIVLHSFILQIASVKHLGQCLTQNKHSIITDERMSECWEGTVAMLGTGSTLVPQVY
jgi:hypothetical protein